MGDPRPIDRAAEAEPISIEWGACGRPEWDRLLTAAGLSSIEQSWSYGEALAAISGLGVERGVLRKAGRPVAVVQTFRRRIGGLAQLIRIVRGPVVLAQVDRAEIHRAVRQSFAKRRRELAFWLPELAEGSEARALMRGLGLRRMVTGYGSAWLDLSPGPEALRAGLAGRWQRSLRLAEASPLTVAIDNDGPALAGSMAVFDRFRRAKRFSGPSGALIVAIAEAGRRSKDVLHLRAMSGGETVAAVVLIRHGAAATYFASWTTAEGRANWAHHLLLWRGIAELKQASTAWLDLGGINTESTPGIARFKVSLGGEPFNLAGMFF